MFTIIIPTHNRPELLRRTLRSLAEQTYKDFKVIIIDDSSNYLPPYDEFLKLKNQYIYILRSGVNGPAESRNMGMAIADSEYILFLDDDDTLEAGHLQTLATHIGSTSPALLFCDFKVQNEDRTTSPPKHLSTDEISISDVTKNSVFVRNRIPNSCLVYRRDVISSVKYEADMLIYEDWDFLLECLKKHNLVHVPSSSVVIHKSRATSPENMRRGNTHDEKIVEVMHYLYNKHPGQNMETKLARQALMASAGISIALEQC